jgi:2-succinyl-6-hydroxy-2,4-cyclohexadiene-1-carboxylate synthase
VTRLVVDGVGLETRALGGGPPVLLLHGFTGRATSWGRLPAALRGAGHRTIVVDLLGHGRSDAPPDPARYAVEQQAADLVALLDRLDARPADLVGYSMGARIALRIAIDHPSAVGRLVLESPSPGIAEPAVRYDRRAADEATAVTIERDGVEAFVDAWEGLPILATQATLPAATRRRLRADRLRNRAVGLAASLRGAGQGTAEPVHDRLGSIAVPTLVVAGRLDPVGSDRAAVVADSIPGARLEIVDGAGHAPHLERPASFRRLVSSFLDPVAAWPADRSGVSRPAAIHRGSPA